jgi:hypothetical protein
MRTLLALALMLGFTGLATAQEKKAEDKKTEEKKADTKKGDPTGTWKWEMDFGGQKREVSLTLKLDGDKLTGSMPGRNNTETKIEEGTFKDGEVSFTVTRMMGDNKIVTKYKGKVDGDTLKMTAETERDGQTNKRDIEAKREKAEEKKDK